MLHSQWNEDVDRGHIRNIHLKDIYVTRAIYNEGHTTSLIGGWDAQHLISGVVFENVAVDGRKVCGPDGIDLYIKHAEGIRFV